MNTRLQTLFVRPLALLALLAACDEDPAAPTGCDAPHGCEIEGFDLAILEAEMDFDADQPFEDAVDAHVVAPGDTVAVRVRIVNRGTETAPPAVLYHTVADGTEPIPSLEPGEERTIRLELAVPDLTMWNELRYQLSVYIGTDSTAWYDDANPDNHWSSGENGLFFHPLVPILDVTLVVPDTVRALHPYILSGRVTNLSPFVGAENLTFAICVYPGNPACNDEPDGPFTSTGTVAPGDSRIVPVGLYAQQEWGVDLNHRETWITLNACFATEEGWPSGRTCALRWYEVVLVPNLAATCDAPLLVAPAIFEVEDPAAECDLGQSPGAELFYVRAFDAQGGEQFRFTAQDSATGLGVLLDFYGVEGEERGFSNLDEPFVFSAPAPARYYVVSRIRIGTGPVPGTVLFEKVE